MKYMLAWVKSKRDVQMRADFHSSGFNAPRRTYNNFIVRAYKHTHTHTRKPFAYIQTCAHTTFIIYEMRFTPQGRTIICHIFYILFDMYTYFYTRDCWLFFFGC